MLSTIGYAAATLSVAYAENHRLLTRFHAGEARLQQLAGQIDRYEQYCDTLSTPSLGRPPAGLPSHSMPLEPSLIFQLDSPPRDRIPVPRSAVLTPMVDWLSRSPAARRVLLVASAALLIFAFVVLNEPSGLPQRQAKRDGPWRINLTRRLRGIGGRYRSHSAQEVA